MERINNILKQLKIEDWTMIIFFASRFFTAIFYTLFGSKGIFITAALLGLLLLISIINKIKKKDLDTLFYFVLFLFAIVILTILTMILNPSTKSWILSFNHGLLIKTFDPRKGIFAALIILLVSENSRMIRNLKITSILMFFYLSFQIILYYLNGSWINYYMLRDESLVLMPYNMSLGYEMIFVALIFFALALREKKKQYAILGLVSFFLSFYFGSRGIVIPLITFVFLSLLFGSNKSDKIQILKWTLFGVCLATLLILVINNWPEKTSLIQENGSHNPTTISSSETNKIKNSNDKSSSGGIENRNIKMLMSNSFTESNGRDKIWLIAWKAIKDKFPLGYGVYGDRPFIGPRFRWGYSHNFFLEMVVSFGIFGGLAVVALGYLVLKYLINPRYRNYRFVLILLLAMNSKLLISDSFWHYNFFWALLAYILFIETKEVRKSSEGKNIMLKETPSSLGFFRELQIKKRAKILGTTLLLVLTIVLSIVFLNDELKDMRYKTIKFSEPTVAIAFETLNIENEYAITETDNEIKISHYISMDVIQNQMKDLSENEKFNNYQISIGKEHLNANEITEIVSKYSQIIPKKQSFHVVKLDASEMHPDIMIALSKVNNASILDKKPNGNYFYRSLKQSDYLQLYSLNATLSNKNAESRLRFVKEQIDLAHENKAFILIHFKNLTTKEVEDMSGEQYTDQRYFMDIVDYLREKGFTFTTIEGLLDTVSYDEQEKSILNLIKNSDIYRSIIR